MKYYLKTLEGTLLKDLLHKPVGTIGSFIVEPKDIAKLERHAKSYCVRNGAKIFNTSRQFIDGKFDVKHIVFMRIIKTAEPRKQRGRPPKI